MKRRRFLLLTITAIVLYLIYETYFKSKPNVITTNKPKTKITTQTYNYETGGGYVDNGGTGGGGGTTNTVYEIFDFKIPDAGKLVRWCSHSYVARPVSVQGELGNANSFIEYDVKDSNGNVILYVKNTRSGLHANYPNQFNHNTHQEQFAKRIPTGNYTLTIKNISVEPVKQIVKYGLIYNNCEDQINENLLSGQVLIRNIQVFDNISDFKLIIDSYENV